VRPRIKILPGFLERLLSANRLWAPKKSRKKKRLVSRSESIESMYFKPSKWAKIIFQMKENNNYMKFLVLLGLGIILSLQHAWLPGFFSDGYLYSVFGKNAAEDGFWLVPHFTDYVYSEFTHHIPLTFILEGLFFKVFGASYVSSRIFASFFYLGSFAVLYQLFRKYRETFAFWTCFLFLSTPPLFKKVRFPNTDISLMLFCLLGFYFFLKTKEHKKWWYLNGVFFGLALLTKGPLAFLIPLAQLISLFWNTRARELQKLTPWLGLVLGFVVFGLWPLGLYSIDKFYIFEKWFTFTFVDTIVGARNGGSPFYTYFLFLAKKAPLWFFLALFGVWKTFKLKSEASLTIKSAATYFLVCLIGLSIPKFKYSNYLILLYPYMSIMAALGLQALLSEKWEKKTRKFVIGIIPIAGLVLLIFPLTNKTRRDPELHKVLEVLSATKRIPSKILILGDLYDYWSMTGKLAFEGYKTQAIRTPKFQEEHYKCRDCAFLVPQGHEPERGLEAAFHFKKRKLDLYFYPEFLKINPKISY
jgi:4-amino-4-deoxy-L-arabinose transferase-like glycosyltransferase